MLLYHPLYDAHHCAYRFFMIYADSAKDTLYWDQLKILDFYILFPHLLAHIKLPLELTSRKPMLRKIKLPYEDAPSPQRLIFELGEIQEQTIKSLVARGIVDKESFSQGRVKIDIPRLGSQIHELIQNDPVRQNEWYAFLTKELSLIPTFGINGLKERTGLMEYRYDPV